ncbi:hypothetical protein [Streptomyces sp. NPDC058434]|uniref:hypothetical protein n=1 Tax=Streptomyces sp. NPDC058434 TaxID=3346498 RepID=UPI003665C002
MLRRRRRALAAGLAVTAAALAAWLPRAQPGPATPHEPAALPRHAPPSQGASAGGGAAGEETRAGAPAGDAAPRPVDIVSAPVRIADAETVRLLEPGDRVDVIAVPRAPATGTAFGRGTGSGGARTGPDARIIVTGARVAEVPGAEGFQDGGALIVLAVPRPVATALAGAGATSRLAVTLC